MKKTLFAFALAVLALGGASCAKNSAKAGVSAEDQAFNDSVTMLTGRTQGAMLANYIDQQLPADERAKFKKESFLRGFKAVLMADTGDIAYLYGLQTGLGFARQIQMMEKDSIFIDRPELFKYFSKAFLADTVNQTAMGMDMQTYERLMSQVQNKIQQRQMAEQQKAEAERVAIANENEAKGAEFIANAIKEDPSIKTTESGLAYKVIKQGTGTMPTDKDIIKMHYTGKLIDGTVFDSSVDRGEPADFTVTQVVPGFGEGLRMMNKGSKYVLYIPASLAYGVNGYGSIPPGSTLIFDVEVLDVTPAK